MFSKTQIGILSILQCNLHEGLYIKIPVIHIALIHVFSLCRGGSTNSSGKGGGVLGRNSSRGRGVRVQVRGTFHILTRGKNL